MGDDLDLPRLRVVVHLEVSAVQLAALEGHLLHETSDLVAVRVERQARVLDVVDRERLAVFVRMLLAADTRKRADTPRIDTRKGIPLVVFDDALLRVLLHIRPAVRQLQPAVAVLLRIDVARRADGKQTREELDVVGGFPLQRHETVVVAQHCLVAVFAAAEVHGHAVRPELRLRGIGQHRERLVAIGSLIVESEVLRRENLADLPVGRAHLPVDIGHDERHMLAGRSRQREDRIVLPVDELQHEGLPHEALDAVELAIVLPFDRRGLLRGVLLRNPEAHALEIHVVVDLQRHAFESRERQAEYVVAHQPLLTRGVIRRRDRQLQHTLPVIDFQFHSFMSSQQHPYPAAMPRASADKSHQHQWLPEAFLSPYSLPRANPAASHKPGAPSAKTTAKQTAKCLILSFPIFMFECRSNGV